MNFFVLAAVHIYATQYHYVRQLVGMLFAKLAKDWKYSRPCLLRTLEWNIDGKTYYAFLSSEGCIKNCHLSQQA